MKLHQVEHNQTFMPNFKLYLCGLDHNIPNAETPSVTVYPNPFYKILSLYLFVQ